MVQADDENYACVLVAGTKIWNSTILIYSIVPAPLVKIKWCFEDRFLEHMSLDASLNKFSEIMKYRPLVFVAMNDTG